MRMAQPQLIWIHWRRRAGRFLVQDQSQGVKAQAPLNTQHTDKHKTRENTKQVAAVRLRVTCLAGTPSDRILLPSERGDSASFFQYMNSLLESRGECASSSPGVGACWAGLLFLSGAVGDRAWTIRAACTPTPPAPPQPELRRGFSRAFHRLLLGSEQRLRPPLTHGGPGAGCCCSAAGTTSFTRTFLLSLQAPLRLLVWQQQKTPQKKLIKSKIGRNMQLKNE